MFLEGMVVTREKKGGGTEGGWIEGGWFHEYAAKEVSSLNSGEAAMLLLRCCLATCPGVVCLRRSGVGSVWTVIS